MLQHKSCSDKFQHVPTSLNSGKFKELNKMLNPFHIQILFQLLPCMNLFTCLHICLLFCRFACLLKWCYARLEKIYLCLHFCLHICLFICKFACLLKWIYARIEKFYFCLLVYIFVYIFVYLFTFLFTCLHFFLLVTCLQIWICVNLCKILEYF